MKLIWEDMEMAEFISSFNIVYKSSFQQRKDKSLIRLQNNRGFISKRNKKCIVRYFLRYDNEQEYYRALCILFLPFRNEKTDIHTKDVELLYKENKELIDDRRAKFEKHRAMVDMIQEIEKNRESKSTFDEIVEDAEYIDEETTTREEIADFEKHVKRQAQVVLNKYNEGNDTLSEERYLSLVEKLNQQQRKLFDDFVERINSGNDEDPFYLYIGGEAGTGKSFLLNLMIDAVKQFGKQSGRELEKPVCLTMAPTGVAAYLVNGSTIESALGIQPQQARSYVSNKSSKNSNLRFLYEDLKVIFLDEVSMCGSDMLAKINFRMQEIMGNNNFMGGVTMVATGDFGQLPPVGQNIIWGVSRIDSRIELCPNHWDDHFRIYYLDEKMRSQDLEFSTICDKVRKGDCDEEVKKYMEQHVRDCANENDNDKYATGKMSIIVTTNPAREEYNLKKLEKLLPSKKAYMLAARDQSTNIQNPPPLSAKLPLTVTGQLQTNIVFKEGAPVMITSNHSTPKYKNNGIVNGARGFIDSIQPKKDNQDVAEVIWVRFTDDRIGQLLRQDSMALLKDHKPNDPLAVPIIKQKKQFRIKGNVNWMREQFPLTLCYGITSHKSQGQTLEEVIIDFTAKNAFITDGSFYTALSRVKYGENFYLKGFKSTYIKANPDVEKKMLSMKISSPYIFYKIYNDVQIFNDPEKELKIGYININSLYHKNSNVFINTDRNLMLLDFLVVADTRLNEKHKTSELERDLFNWKLIERVDSKDGMIHMGLLLLQSSRSEKGRIVSNLGQKQFFKTEKGRKVIYMQILSVYFLKYHISAAFVYIRQTPSDVETKLLENYLDSYDLVMGDLNLDSYRAPDQQKIEYLVKRRSKVLNEITTIRFNQLDHILLDCALFPEFFATSFRNHTTDHHTVVVRIAELGNKVSESFLQNINFDKRNWTKHTKRKWNEDERAFEKSIKQKQAKCQNRKRKVTSNIEKEVQSKQVREGTSQSHLHRTFRNPDAESCWVNSCLQMVLTAMDYTEKPEENGSPLWNELIYLQQKGKSTSLNPLKVRDIIIQAEKNRIRRDNIVPLNRLFPLENMEMSKNRDTMHKNSRDNRIGQQDCKDFFICLSENREQWYDVFNMFMIESESFTICQHCSHVSRPKNSNANSSFLFFECPDETVTMSSFLEEKLNHFEIRENWKDEDGCGERTIGKNCNRIKDIKKTQNLIFVIERLTNYGGNLEIVRRKVSLGGDLNIKDVKGNSGRFTPIAVIHHTGEIINNSTQGHYQTDVLDAESRQWIRTSDNEVPLRINQVSDEGYVYMYKKIQ